MRHLFLLVVLAILAAAIIRPSLSGFAEPSRNGVEAPLSGGIRLPANSTPAKADDWRRTAFGWQRQGNWVPPQRVSAMGAIHPGIAGALILLASLGGLVAFQNRF